MLEINRTRAENRLKSGKGCGWEAARQTLGDACVVVFLYFIAVEFIKIRNAMEKIASWSI